MTCTGCSHNGLLKGDSLTSTPCTGHPCKLEDQKHDLCNCQPRRSCRKLGLGGQFQLRGVRHALDNSFQHLFLCQRLRFAYRGQCSRQKMRLEPEDPCASASMSRRLRQCWASSPGNNPKMWSLLLLGSVSAAWSWTCFEDAVPEDLCPGWAPGRSLASEAQACRAG